MVAQTRHKLNNLLSKAQPGVPLTVASLAKLGVSSSLAVHYAKAGWLIRVAQGIYALPNAPLQLQASLTVLQEKLPGLHVGGKTALDWHGIRQYVSPSPELQLYGWEAAKLPEWFTSRFPSTYKRKRLFEEAPSEMLGVKRHDDTQALVSCAERAVLEMLSEVGLNQPLQEARELLESTLTLRSKTLMELLTRCNSVKTVRLCLKLGRELRLPWSAKLQEDVLPTGSSSPWVAKTPDGLLVL